MKNKTPNRSKPVEFERKILAEPLTEDIRDQEIARLQAVIEDARNRLVIGDDYFGLDGNFGMAASAMDHLEYFRKQCQAQEEQIAAFKASINACQQEQAKLRAFAEKVYNGVNCTGWSDDPSLPICLHCEAQSLLGL